MQNDDCGLAGEPGLGIRNMHIKGAASLRGCMSSSVVLSDMPFNQSSFFSSNSMIVTVANQ